jgi:serine/threonine protein kinase
MVGDGMPTIGRYEIIEELGQGTMGAVYKANDPVMDRNVAIKRILVSAIEGPEGAEFRERFFREARAAGRLAHQGIVAMFDVAEHEGTPFLVMEYVAGQTLQSILQNGERMDLGRVCDLGMQLADAVDYAHRNGVIHRDIKPANLLVTADDRIKIADFGVARMAESHLSSCGRLLGTPAYMAPEQFTGIPIDGRADLFSIGVVIYFMATGEKPFAGETIIGVQYKVVHTDPVPPRKLNPAISADLESVILKCIQKDPAQRYQSGAELACDLQACRASVPIFSQAAAAAPKPSPTSAVLDPTVVLPNNPAAPVRRVRAKSMLLVLIPALATFFAVAAFRLVKMWMSPPEVSVALPAPLSPPPPIAEAKPDPPVTVVPLEVPPESPLVKVTESKKTAKTPEHKERSAVAVTKPRISAPAPVPAAVPLKLPESTVPTPNHTPLVAATRDEPVPDYKSARLLITSPSVPETLTIVVTVDNELLFRREPPSLPSNPQRGSDAFVELRDLRTSPFEEERALAPGKHKIQVHLLMAAQRIARVQEVTERFYSGQRRVLQIELPPDFQRLAVATRDDARFNISIK